MAGAKQKTPFQGVMVGRLVQGDAFVPQTKDQQGNPRVVKSGPNMGQPSPQYFIAVAYAKSDPNWPAFMAMLHGVAAAEWPGLFPANLPPAPLFGIMARPSANPLFTFKVKDGDGLDRNGKSNADKEGFAGHWIVSYASAYPPKVVRPTGPGTWEQLSAPAAGQDSPVKRGYYVRVAGSCASNDSPNTPGLYVNLDMIELVGIGPEIIGGPDAATAFAAPAVLPPGATALGAMPPAGAVVPPAPGAVVPPPAAAAAARVMLPAAGGQTYEALIGAGWTDALLVQHGMMAAPAAAAAPPPPPAAAALPPPPPVASPPVTPPPPYGGFRDAKVMTAAAGGATYEQMIAGGWTDETLVANGMMQPPLAAGAPGSPASPAGSPPVPPAPSVPASPASPTPSPTRTMTAAAQGATYEQMVAGGWTDAQLIAQGYMLA